MRRFLVALSVFALMIAFTNLAAAQTIDIVDYMAVTPGQRQVENSEDMCSGVSEINGDIISTAGSYTLVNDYGFRGGIWVPDCIEVLQITPSNVMRLGEYDHASGMFSVYSPPYSIPRSLSLNEPVFTSGTVTTGSETEPYAEILMITETGVSVTTPAGTFNNCIKIKIAAIEDSSSTYTSTEILAPGLGSVQAFEAWTTDEGGGGVDVGSVFTEITAYGGP